MSGKFGGPFGAILADSGPSRCHGWILRVRVIPENGFDSFRDPFPDPFLDPAVGIRNAHFRQRVWIVYGHFGTILGYVWDGFADVCGNEIKEEA